ncbi:MAG: C40 family peptidase [Acidobacteriota bacterium]|nr:C40 family peptidase [Acidobacteriota bacterium]
MRGFSSKPRAPIAICALALGFVPAAVAGAAAPAPVTAGGWDAAQQRTVVHAGLMADLGGSFDGALALTPGQANAALAALAARLPASISAVGAHGPRAGRGAVSVVSFDALLVGQLGLADVAAHVQRTAVAAGLRPPWYFGSEVLARFLELRYEQPIGHEALDLYPDQPITRAEAAWSLARVLAFAEWNVVGAREALGAFELPRMSTGQLAALRVAVSKIGYPYVWGGTTDGTEDGLAHGGYDCSGFVWRVFKLSGLPWGQRIKGRTAAEQAGEIARSERLRAGQLQPGDLLFFGSARFASKATEQSVTHEGIYLGDNWVIHSSGQGVYVLPLQGGWLGESFAWGRRVIG